MIWCFLFDKSTWNQKMVSKSNKNGILANKTISRDWFNDDWFWTYIMNTYDQVIMGSEKNSHLLNLSNELTFKHNQQPFYSTPLIIKPLGSPWHPWPTLSAPETYIFRSIQSQRAFLGRGFLAKGGEPCMGSYNNKGMKGWPANLKPRESSWMIPWMKSQTHPITF